jgi:predicted nucleic acid-binding protein
VTRYLLDTNHLSAYLDRNAAVEIRVDTAVRTGLGSACPSCEYRAGIRVSRRYQQNLARLEAALHIFRLWPADERTATEFAELFRELRAAGKMLSQFDHLIAAIARRHNLTLLSADHDFDSVSRLKIENWL